MNLTRFQHFVALAIIVPAFLLSLVSIVINVVANWCEAICDWCSAPFLRLHASWVDRCEKAGREALRSEGERG